MTLAPPVKVSRGSLFAISKRLKLAALPPAAFLLFLLLALPSHAKAAGFQVDTGGTLTTSFVSYYKLEDTTDSFGGKNLTNTGGSTFIAGKVNKAVNLDGTSQYLSVASPLSTSTTNISMFMWVNLSSSTLKGTFAGNDTDSNGVTSVGYPTIESYAWNGDVIDVVFYFVTDQLNESANKLTYYRVSPKEIWRYDLITKQYTLLEALPENSTTSTP